MEQHTVRADQVIAKEFILADAEGRVKGGLSLDDYGNPLLQIGESEGSRLSVHVKKDVVDLVLTDHNSSPVLRVSVDEGRPGINFMDAAEQMKMGILLCQDGKPMIALRDFENRSRLFITLDKDERPAIALVNENGETQVTFQLNTEGKPEIFINPDSLGEVD